MTKSLKHWYPRYSGDYRAKTAGLSLIQHGAYTLLLDEYYNTGKPLSANASVLHRICSALAPEEQEAINFILEYFFVKTDEGYRNKRADEELVKRGDISEKRKQAANSRHANAMQTPCKIDANAPAIAYTSTSTSTSTITDTPITKVKEGKNFVLPLPEWLPLNDWNDYLEMRDKKGKGKATNRAKQLVIIKLDELRKTGQDPSMILQQSIINGWTSVFEIKKDYQNGKYKQKHTGFGEQDWLAGTEGFDTSGKPF